MFINSQQGFTNASCQLSDFQGGEMKALLRLSPATCFVLLDDNKFLIIDYGRIVPQLFAWSVVRRSNKGKGGGEEEMKNETIKSEQMRNWGGKTEMFNCFLRFVT